MAEKWQDGSNTFLIILKSGVGYKDSLMESETTSASDHASRYQHLKRDRKPSMLALLAAAQKPKKEPPIPKTSLSEKSNSALLGKRPSQTPLERPPLTTPVPKHKPTTHEPFVSLKPAVAALSAGNKASVTKPLWMKQNLLVRHCRENNEEFVENLKQKRTFGPQNVIAQADVPTDCQPIEDDAHEFLLEQFPSDCDYKFELPKLANCPEVESPIVGLFSQCSESQKTTDLCLDHQDPKKIYYLIDNQNKAMPFVVEKPEIVFAAQHQDSQIEDLELQQALCRSVNFGVTEAQENVALALQQANEDPTEGACKIKIGQATLRLKRTCGVSYIKQPESRQIGAADNISPIPPLVIQCSAMIEPLSQSHPSYNCIEEHCDSLFALESPLTFSFSQAPHETDFRLGLLRQLDHIEQLSNPSETRETASPNAYIPFEHLATVPSLRYLGLLIHPNTYVSALLPTPDIIRAKIPYMVLGLHTKRSVSSKSSFLHRIGRSDLVANSNKPADISAQSILQSLVPVAKEALDKETSFSLQAVDKIARELFASRAEDFHKLLLPFEAAKGLHHNDSTDSGTESTQPARLITPADTFLLKLLDVEGLNLHTVAIKVECYIPERVWKSLEMEEKRILTTMCHGFKRNFDALLLQWSIMRDITTDLTQVTIAANQILLPPLWGAKQETDLAQSITNFETLIPAGWRPSLNVPLYTVDTRDSFAFDPVIQEETVQLRGRSVLKKTYFFHADQLPSNYGLFIARNPDLAKRPRLGVVTYEGLYSEEELKHIEAETLETEKCYLQAGFLPHTGQALLSGRRLKRTKFFFGSRYLWTASQLAHPHSKIASGIRTDVSPVPLWMRRLVEDPMIEAGIVDAGFVNSVALNVYHDGEEGLGQHFDDAIRFRQPIFSLRVFSDARLAFGSQLYNFCNGAFCIPMSRGTVTVLEEDSFAANGLKHCIRPVDMAGKSAAFILRQMHPQAVADARLYDWYVDLPHKLHTMSVEVDEPIQTASKTPN